MSLPKPVPDLPFIVSAEDAGEYLSQISIDIDQVKEALRSGELAASNMTLFHPVTGPGFNRWAYTVGALREALSDSGFWNPEDIQNRPFSTHKKGEHTLSTISANSETGSTSVTAMPKARRKKGRATEEFIRSGQQEVFSILDFIEEPEEFSAPPRGDWFLLYFRDKDELRAEISLPKDFEDGQFTSWYVRVLLPTIDFTSALAQPLDAGEESVDFTIADREDIA